MAAYMLDTTDGGPIAAVVDASEWQTYTGGVVKSCGMDVGMYVREVDAAKSGRRRRRRNPSRRPSRRPSIHPVIHSKPTLFASW